MTQDAPRVRAFLASSLDGFIAGPQDQLDWLPGHDAGEDTFTPFMRQVGAILMGRRTYDVVEAFDGPWPYGEVPVLVATTRPLHPKHPTLRPVQGCIGELLAEASRCAGARDVYVDGGVMVRAALDAGRLDELTLTLIPILLGEGIRLFNGGSRRALTCESVREIGGGMVQLRYRLNA